jgi:hypothetical protein
MLHINEIASLEIGNLGVGELKKNENFLSIEFTSSTSGRLCISFKFIPDEDKMIYHVNNYKFDFVLENKLFESLKEKILSIPRFRLTHLVDKNFFEKSEREFSFYCFFKEYYI